MRAMIVGAPVEIDGEPAEIAQLVELLTSGAVVVEHKHRFRLEDPDDAGMQRGACWCGETREYQPFDALSDAKRKGFTLAKAPEPVAATNTVALKKPRALGRIQRSCSLCGVAGHRRDKCPTLGEGAA